MTGSRGGVYLEAATRLKSAQSLALLFYFAVVAQLVEHFHGKEEVAGSIPANSSKNLVNKGNTIIDNISII